MKYSLSVEKWFSSAHALRGYKGKCENIHGHNWKVKVVVSGSKLNNIGILIDFTELKKTLSDILEVLDHKNLNEIKPFNRINPSAENIAAFVFKNFENALSQKAANVSLVEVSVWESETSCATAKD